MLADVPGATWAAEMLRAGARALLPHDASGEAIIAAVAGAAAGLVDSPSRSGALIAASCPRGVTTGPSSSC